MGLIKVVHIIGGGEIGGAERHIINLARAVDPQKVAISICCLFETPLAGLAASAGINTFVVTMRNRLDFTVAGKLAALINEHGFDLVHTHGVRANLLGRLAARQASKPVVTTVHSLLEMDYPGFITRQVNYFTEWATRSWTRRFITVSGALKAKLVAAGVPEERITVIYNGIDLEAFSREIEPGTARAELGLAPGVPLVGIVARLHPVKGHQYFIAAAKQVLEQRPDVRFVVAGEGHLRTTLEEMAAELGIESQVFFTGFVADIRPLMTGLDLLVIASLWEGFGLTAVEAMALGVPVVSTEVGGLPEVVLHGETGLLVPPADPAALAKGILWLLEHPVAVAGMSNRAKQIVQEKFTSRVMARQTEELYRKVLGEKP